MPPPLRPNVPPPNRRTLHADMPLSYSPAEPAPNASAPTAQPLDDAEPAATGSQPKSCAPGPAAAEKTPNPATRLNFTGNQPRALAIPTEVPQPKGRSLPHLR
jgi:hypothetical protein